MKKTSDMNVARRLTSTNAQHLRDDAWCETGKKGLKRKKRKKSKQEGKVSE